MPQSSGPMRIVSWNVNGLRACAREAFPKFLRESARRRHRRARSARACPPSSTPRRARPLAGTRASRPAGRAIAAWRSTRARSRTRSLIGVGERRFDVEGRLITARFGRTFVVNGYFPKGSGSKRDNSRVPYKLDFYAAVLARAQIAAAPRRRIRRSATSTPRTRRSISRGRRKTRSPAGSCPRSARPSARLDRCGLGGYLPRAPSRRRRPLHVVAAVGRRARAQRRLADRLRARVAERRERVTDAFIWPEVRGSDHAPRWRRRG